MAFALCVGGNPATLAHSKSTPVMILASPVEQIHCKAGF